MGLRLFFLPTFPGAMFIQGAMFIPDSRVRIKSSRFCKPPFAGFNSQNCTYLLSKIKHCVMNTNKVSRLAKERSLGCSGSFLVVVLFKFREQLCPLPW